MDSLNAVCDFLERRREQVILEVAKPGSPLYSVIAHIPVIDSFIYNNDLRLDYQISFFK